MKVKPKNSREWYFKRYGEATDAILELKIKKGRGDSPWNKAYYNMRNRCENKKDKKFAYYGSRNFKCKVKPKQLRALYFRDKAWLLKTPSVDRIDPDKGYSEDNIRWIEWEENRRIRLWSYPKRDSEFQIIKKVCFNSFIFPTLG